MRPQSVWDCGWIFRRSFRRDGPALCIQLHVIFLLKCVSCFSFDVCMAIHTYHSCLELSRRGGGCDGREACQTVAAVERPASHCNGKLPCLQDSCSGATKSKQALVMINLLVPQMWPSMATHRHAACCSSPADASRCISTVQHRLTLHNELTGVMTTIKVQFRKDQHP